MAYTITQIEDAIVAKLQASAVLTALNATIASYHGEIDDLVKQAKQLTVKLPAIYTLYGGSNFDESANRSFDDEMSFTVIVIAKDLRGDAKLEAAMYPILEEIKTVLIDNDLGLNIEPLHPIGIDSLLVTKMFSIFAVEFKTLISL